MELFHYLKDTIILQYLEVLILESNKIRKIPEALGNLKLLQKFSISKNQLTQLPVSTGRLQNLRSIDLRNNCISILDIDGLQILTVKFDEPSKITEDEILVLIQRYIKCPNRSSPVSVDFWLDHTTPNQREYLQSKILPTHPLVVKIESQYMVQSALGYPILL